MLLTIPNDETSAYRPRRETRTEMNGSLFRAVYQQAEQNLSDLWNRRTDPSALTEYSNILAFTGGRGAGKTSAMLNVASLLESGEKLDGSRWKQVKFVPLPMVDPSHLSPEETLTDIVLSRLYHRFEAHCNTLLVPIEDRRIVYQAFHTAYCGVRAMCQSRAARHQTSDSLDGLQFAAAGHHLREHLHTLVTEFLRVLCPKARGCLLLCVDDVDMNLRQGYPICEELRKYWSIPNVIILFSLCLDQMDDLVRQQYLGEFSVLLRHPELPPSGTVPNMAEKYLQKLIPFGRRCALPSMELQQIRTVQVRWEGEETQRPLTDEVLVRLYRTTGLILVKQPNQTHPFLPNTLRGVVHLLALLKKLPEVELVRDRNIPYCVEEAERAVLLDNLSTVARYVQEYHIPALPPRSAALLHALLQEPSETLNLRAARMLYHALEESGTCTKSELNGLYDFSARVELPPENVTVGDVLCLMRLYSRRAHTCDGTGDRFSALFRLLYSVRILQVFFGPAPEDSFAARKDRLYRLLGGLIYRPETDDVLRGKELYQNLSVEKLKARAETDAALVDTLLAGTVYLGIPNTAKNRQTTFRAQKVVPYYEEVSREALTGGRGNTFRYFTYSYLGCILAPLRSGLDIRTAGYAKWCSQYLTPLPVLSADCIDAYVCGLRRASENERKSSAYPSKAVEKGTDDLLKDLLNRTGLDPAARTVWENAFTDFPFLEENAALDTYLLEGNPAPLPEDPEARIASLNRALKNLENGKARYQSAQDIPTLKKMTGILMGNEELQEEEKEQIRLLNADIKERKASIGDKDILFFQSTVKEICQQIEAYIRSMERARDELEGQLNGI